jgi:peptide subunit release factor 1 (eRF1)
MDGWTVTKHRIVVDEPIRRAKETGVRIHFIAYALLLAAMGGVGATLHYRMPERVPFSVTHLK